MSSCQPRSRAATPGRKCWNSAGLGLYVHVPFCKSRCLYCDFYSTAAHRVPWETYAKALDAELAMLAESPFATRGLETVFVGGGTPTVYPPAFFESLLESAFSRFPPARDAEITVECNPGTVTPHDLQRLRAIGVNRLSLGVQSFQDQHLDTLTRLHDGRTARKTIEAAAAAGFDNLSVDLIWGIPDQTVADWTADLNTLISLPVEHCSTYGLTVYEGTRLARHVSSGHLRIPSEDTLISMHHTTASVLGEAGFRRYEISNWSRRRPCRHNLRYWEGHDWLGIGAGAHGYSANFSLILPPPGAVLHTPPRFVPAPHGGRWWTHQNIGRYITDCLHEHAPYAGAETLTRQQAMTETLIVQLRRSQGLDMTSFRNRFGPDPARQVLARGRARRFQGLVEVMDNALRLTPAGILLTDRIILALSEAADQGLGQTRPGQPTTGVGRLLHTTPTDAGARDDSRLE